uniref:Uncharacterized protein n=1 Tax=Anguilla anguilla TaxID=7936 RepID=A0A0E9QPX6_ANGAN
MGIICSKRSKSLMEYISSQDNY